MPPPPSPGTQHGQVYTDPNTGEIFFWSDGQGESDGGVLFEARWVSEEQWWSPTGEAQEGGLTGQEADIGQEPDWWAATGIPWASMFDEKGDLRSQSAFVALSKAFNPALAEPEEGIPGLEFAYTQEPDAPVPGQPGRTQPGRRRTWVWTGQAWKDITDDPPANMQFGESPDGRPYVRIGDKVQFLDPLPSDAVRYPANLEAWITQLFVDGGQENWALATAIQDWRDRPTQMQLFDRALQLAQLKMEYAKSPLDYIVLSKMRRGLEVTEAERGLRAYENIDRWFDQVFPDLLLADVGLDKASVAQRQAEESYDAGVTDTAARAAEATKTDEGERPVLGTPPAGQERAYQFPTTRPTFAPAAGVGAMTQAPGYVAPGARPGIYSGGAPFAFGAQLPPGAQQGVEQAQPVAAQSGAMMTNLPPGAAGNQSTSAASSSAVGPAAPLYGNREMPYVFQQKAGAIEPANQSPVWNAGFGGDWAAVDAQRYQDATRPQKAPVRNGYRYPGSDIPAVSQFFFQPNTEIQPARPIGPQVGLPVLRDVGAFQRLSPTEQELVVGEFQSRGLSGAELERDLLTHTIGTGGRRRPFTFAPRRRR